MYKPPTQSEASVSETRGLKMFKEQPAAASTATSVTSDVRGLPFVVPEAADASDEGGKGDIGLFFFSGHGKENDKQIVLVRRTPLADDQLPTLAIHGFECLLRGLCKLSVTCSMPTLRRFPAGHR